MPNIHPAIMTELVKISAKERAYSFPLARFDARGLAWNTSKEVTLKQFQMVAGQGALKILSDDEKVFLRIPLCKVPGFCSWTTDNGKDVVRLDANGRLKLTEDWKAVVEFFDEEVTVTDIDDLDRRPRSGRKWGEFPGEIGLRLIFV